MFRQYLVRLLSGSALSIFPLLLHSIRSLYSFILSDLRIPSSENNLLVDSLLSTFHKNVIKNYTREDFYIKTSCAMPNCHTFSSYIHAGSCFGFQLFYKNVCYTLTRSL